MSEHSAARAGESVEAHHTPRWVLWFVVLAGPVAWTLGFNADYALVRIACTEQTMLPLHLVTLVTLPLAMAGGWVAWRHWRPRKGIHEMKPAETLPHFMLALGLLTSIFFSATIVAQWSAKLFLNPCMGI